MQCVLAGVGIVLLPAGMSQQGPAPRLQGLHTGSCPSCPLGRKGHEDSGFRKHSKLTTCSSAPRPSQLSVTLPGQNWVSMSWLGCRAHSPSWNMQCGDNRAKCNHCLQKKLSRIYLLEVTEEYEFYTPFKMLFISLSLGALSTSNFTHSYNSPPNSSCFSSGFLRSHFGLCPLRCSSCCGWRQLHTGELSQHPLPNGGTHTCSVSEWHALGTA